MRMTNYEPEWLEVEEDMPEMRCKYCSRIFEAGDQVLIHEDNLYCSERCASNYLEMLYDAMLERRFEEMRNGD